MLKGINSRWEDADNKAIQKTWDMVLEITQSEQEKKKKNFKNEENLRDPWDNIKQTNIQLTGITEGE